MYMMWYDDSKRSQADKIKQAVDVYTQRFGVVPTVALVNPDEVVEVDGVVVRGASNVRKCNIWVGRE